MDGCNLGNFSIALIVCNESPSSSTALQPNLLASLIPTYAVSASPSKGVPGGSLSTTALRIFPQLSLRTAAATENYCSLVATSTLTLTTFPKGGFNILGIPSTSPARPPNVQDSTRILDLKKCKFDLINPGDNHALNNII